MLIVTNKMQRNTILFIAVKAVYVSGGFPAHHQELKNCTCSIWYLLSLVAAHLQNNKTSYDIWSGDMDCDIWSGDMDCDIWSGDMDCDIWSGDMDCDK
jgi:hypothetical protein